MSTDEHTTDAHEGDRRGDEAGGHGPREVRRTRGLLPVPEGVAAWLIAVATVIAVVQFFRTGSWLWFFLVPVVTTIVYGMGGPEDAR